MNRWSFIIAAMALATLLRASHAQNISIKTTGPSGHSTAEFDGITGNAPRIRYDSARAIVTLEGSAEVPATLRDNRTGTTNPMLQGMKILYDFKTGRLRVEGTAR